ncbi:MAG: hypothetical protein C0485_01130 [Pirellula sp.]|nr:hypothetical protein [Pirellula sp.]
MITCDQCRSELAEHALGHLSAEISATVDEHLAACPVCRHESAALAAAWSALPMALAPVAPSADLFDRITARIDDSPAAWRQVAPASSADAIIPAGGNASPLTSRQRLLSYVLAASLFIGLSVSFVRLTQPSRDDAVAIAAIQELAERLGKLQRREADRLLQSEHFRLASLHGPETPDSAQAYVVWDLMGKQWHFYASDLPPAPAGQTYQLWATTRAGAFLPGPTFVVNDEGLGSAVADFPKLSPRDGAKAVITLEPLEGSEQPSGKTILEATL